MEPHRRAARIVATASLALLLSVARPTAAYVPGPPHWTGLTPYVLIGAGLPIGNFGTLVEVNPWANLAFVAGVGTAFGPLLRVNVPGPQVTTGVRGRIIFGHLALSLGILYAGGRHAVTDEWHGDNCMFGCLGPSRAAYRYDWAHWVHTELAFEKVIGRSGHARIRFSLGAAALLNPHSGRCAEGATQQCAPRSSPFQPSVGFFSYGWTFS